MMTERLSLLFVYSSVFSLSILVCKLECVLNAEELVQLLQPDQLACPLQVAQNPLQVASSPLQED
jgi:hypothetical protein